MSIHRCRPHRRPHVHLMALLDPSRVDVARDEDVDMVLAQTQTRVARSRKKDHLRPELGRIVRGNQFRRRRTQRQEHFKVIKSVEMP